MTRISGSLDLSRPLAFGLAATVLALCLSVSGKAEPIAPVADKQSDTDRPEALDRTVELADRLQRAEDAYEAGDRAALATILTAFTTAPPRPLQADEEARFETWTAAAGVDQPPMRGRVLGPGYMRGILKPGESWSHDQNFMAGEPASLAVSNRGSGPLELRVSNAGQSPVCAFRADAKKVCRFTPIYTQRYRIELSNQGAEDAVYYVVID